MESGRQASFSEVTQFHGHTCLGTVLGYRIGQAAMRELSASRSADEELVAIVENDSCSVDAIQVLTGCTFGKGNLLFRDFGKHVYTFMRRNGPDAVRISLKSSADFRQLDTSWDQLREKVFSGSATPEEQRAFKERGDMLCDRVMQIPEEDILKVEHVKVTDLPAKARIHRSIQCQKCGEPVSEHRARIENSRVICIPCYENSKSVKCPPCAGTRDA
ncbi:MAG: FmdE family protein [Halobacteriota archaeon]